MIADIVQTGLSSWWAPALAFAAGLVSCLSPCVWPLLPGYLSFITGRADRRRGVGRRSHAAGADAAVHPGVHDRVRAARGVRLDVRAGVQGHDRAAGGRRDRDHVRGADDRVRAAARLDGALRRAPAVPRPRAPGQRRRGAARHGVRCGLDPLHRPRARVDPRDRRERQHGEGGAAAGQLLGRARRAVPARRSRGDEVHGRLRLGEAPVHARSRSSRGRSWSRSACCCSPGEFTRIVAPLAERFTLGI